MTDLVLASALGLPEAGPPPVFVAVATYGADDLCVGTIRGEPAQVVAVLAFRLRWRPELTWRVLPDAYAAVIDAGGDGQHVPTLADLPAPPAAPR